MMHPTDTNRPKTHVFAKPRVLAGDLDTIAVNYDGGDDLAAPLVSA